VKFKDRGSVKEICKWADVAKSSFHYKAHPGQRGMKASTHTPIGDGVVENSLVVEQIRAVLGMDYCAYGYHVMTSELRGMGYFINPKKVYRLMDENHLLCGKKIKTKGKRDFVKFRRINATRPMEYLCLDIKYVWVHGESRWYYQLSIMDVFSRRILCWIFQRSVKQSDVIGLMRGLDLRFGLKGVIIRNDNGSQFIAHAVRQTLKDLEAKQEFTHVATPEENAYIESFHSIQQRELMDRFEFSSYYHARQHIEKYMYWYNCLRRHGSLNDQTPQQKWDRYERKKLNFTSSGKAEVGNAGEQPTRNIPINGDGMEGMLKIVPAHFHPIDIGSSLLLMPLKTQSPKEGNRLNSFEKNVQLIGG
jgi:transposase InsO family protein